jgi:hypothetical protein
MDLRRMAFPPGRRPGGERKSRTGKSIGKTMREDVAGYFRDMRKMPNGSPVVMVVGPSKNPPLPVSQVRAL